MVIMVINITDDKRLTSQQCSYMPLLLRLSAERISKHQLQAVHILAHDTRTSSTYRYRYILRYANIVTISLSQKGPHEMYDTDLLAHVYCYIRPPFGAVSSGRSVPRHP